MDIILASSSPRRQMILNQIGCVYKIVTSNYQESNNLLCNPVELAISNSLGKALDVAKHNPLAIVIGADTVVVHNGQVFGKPKNAEDAIRMLKILAGQNHQVITGLAVVVGNTKHTDYAETNVKMRWFSNEEIDSYVATGEPLDKAGAYGIQEKGALLVESIEGCYYNVVGLPLVILNRLLGKVGVSLL